MLASDNQFIDDICRTESIAAKMSPRLRILSLSVGSTASVSDASSAAPARPVTPIQGRTACARCCGDATPAVAMEKCTMFHPRDTANPHKPITASAVRIRPSRSRMALLAIVALVIPGAIKVRVLAVFLSLPVVHLIENDAGDLLVARELLRAVLDRLARRRGPTNHQDDRIAELGDDDRIDHRSRRGSVDHDKVECLLAAGHDRFHSIGAQEIRRVLSLVACREGPIAFALMEPDDFRVLDLAKQQVDQARLLLQTEETRRRRMTQVGIDE